MPVPLGVDLTGLGLVANESERSIKLCLPPTMRLPARFPIAEIFREICAESATEQLAEWQDVLNMGEQGTGLRRYAQILPLHFYRNIVLSSRYANRLMGHTERLDIAFAKYFRKIGLKIGADSVKKMRLATPHMLLHYLKKELIK